MTDIPVRSIDLERFRADTVRLLIERPPSKNLQVPYPSKRLKNGPPLFWCLRRVYSMVRWWLAIGKFYLLLITSLDVNPSEKVGQQPGTDFVRNFFVITFVPLCLRNYLVGVSFAPLSSHYFALGLLKSKLTPAFDI